MKKLDNSKVGKANRSAKDVKCSAKKLNRSAKKNFQKAEAKTPKITTRKIVKFFWILIAIIAATALLINLIANNSAQSDYIVETNAFFAPFEFYENGEIKGVDVEIIEKVAEKLGKTIAIKDVEFDVIIDNVSSGKLADAGAAGLTITDARKAKVDFSIPYYTSTQYIIYSKTNPVAEKSHITWQDLENKVLGSQTGGTGYLFAQSEISDGELKNSETVIKGFDSHQLAADAIISNIIDFAIVDELPAKYIVAKNSNLAAAPLYYETASGEYYLTEESYAIAVNKNRPELLAAFNEVLTEMLKKDENGETEIDRLILKYSGIEL